MNDGTDKDLLCEAIEQYENGSYHSAAISFRNWRTCNGTNDLKHLQALAVAADHALCRFRACTNPIYRDHVLYREAIIANRSYLSAIRQLERSHAVVEAALLTTVSAAWIHTKMNNIKMARHKVWDILQWAIPPNQTCTIQQNVELLSKWLPVQSQALPKFQHVLNILNVLENKDLARLEKGGVTNNARLNDQKEALYMIVRRKLGKNVGPPAASEVALKIQTVIQATDEVTRTDGIQHNIILEHQLAKVVDKSNPSDLNLLGCLQVRRDCSSKVLHSTFARALELLRHGQDTKLLQEISFNIATCLLQIGDYKPAKELLFWLLGQDEGCFPKEAIPIDVGHTISRDEALWSAFAASTLDDDIVATLTIADMWKNESRATYISTTLAVLFAFSQANRMSLIKQAIQESNFPIHLAKLMGLNCIVPVNLDIMTLCTTRGLTVACLYNNLGFTELRNGNDQSALALLQKACSSVTVSTNAYFHPYYNITLLLLQKNDISGAFKCWNQVRHLERDEQQSIQQVIEQLDTTVQDYARCKQIYQQGRTISLTSLLPPISQGWSARGIGGLPSTWVLLLDCIMLQHRLNEMRHEALDKLVVELENMTHKRQSRATKS